jgi:pimeloyl-ACP methyl ester carboxylesterase
MRTVLAALVLLACAGQQAAPGASPPPLERCHLTGVDAEVRCGTVTVFEDREAASGRTIDLRVVVVPAVRPDPEPDPVFFLAGGPGQAASEIVATVMPSFQRIQQRRDLVFVDQRGTGASNALDCPPAEAPTFADGFSTAVEIDEVIECRDRLAEHADLTKYTTDIAMDDLDQVRAQLGYESINLYGASYGTRAGLEYARRHPDHLRAMILDGLAPQEMVLFLDFGRDAQRALDLLVEDCTADTEGCGASFPDLAGELSALWTRPPEAPPVSVAHPRTGVAEDVPLEGAALAGALRGVLYTPTITSLLPLAVHEAAGDNWAPLLTLSSSLGDGVSETMSVGMMLSVVCAEDWPRVTAEDRAAAAQAGFLGDTLVDTLEQWCAVWPTAPPPPGAGEPVSWEGPTLLLSGGLDPVTPPRWGTRAAEHLPASLHVIAPGAGHNVSPHGCAPQLMAEFIEAGSAADLDATCIAGVKRPPFFIDYAGPAR